ncbi:hypothetical protein Bca101_068207 [Brassica carinata]
MEALHEPTWRKAGIFEAIKASTYNIIKNPSLLLSVSKKWCPETNSFVFPWGEATITLEDVMILLGFSVLGSPVLSPSLGSSEMRAGESVAREEGERSRRSISKRVVPIAVRLARGERIALAPAVLAGVYRDLGLISGFGRGEDCDGKLSLKSLLKLVQVWTWERFKNLRPKAKEIPKGEPRIAQWDSLQQRHIRILGDEFASFARCVRVSQLVGDGFVESYYPNRVAMQFGLSQDLPGLVTCHRDFTEKEAWDDYNKSLDGLKLYMPSRLASVVENLEEGFPATRTRSRMRRLANKDKICELVNSLVSSSWKMKGAHEDDEESYMDEKEDDNMTIAQIKSRRKYSDVDKAGEDASEPLGKRRKFQVMDSDNDSGYCQKLASVKIEERNEEYDDTASNIQQKTSPICDDEVDVNGDTAGKKSMIVDEAKRVECWLLEEKNLSIKEKESKLEARVMEVEKTLGKIREWNTRGNNIKTEATA